MGGQVVSQQFMCTELHVGWWARYSVPSLLMSRSRINQHCPGTSYLEETKAQDAVPVTYPMVLMVLLQEALLMGLP